MSLRRSLRFVTSLELGYLATSRIFLTVLGLFFLQLALVLVSRAGPTWRKIRPRPRSEAGLVTWAHTGEGLSAPLPAGWDPAVGALTLRGFGYRAKRVGERTWWGVKHRTAPLGFLLFHLSFFLLCAGGILLYTTRFAGTAVLTEGQEFSGYKEVLRHPLVGGPPRLAFAVDQVEPRFEQGEPVHLGASFLFRQAGSMVAGSARVNHPVRWGATSILVQQAGIAPVLWLQDRRGYTLDRVAAAVTRGDPTRVPLAEERFLAVIHPPAADAAFPTREDLPTTPLRLAVFRRASPQDGDSSAEDDELLFEGALRPGEAAPLADGRLVLEELRYWVGIQVVSERGGGLLTAGFVAGIVGLIWRLLLYRREVALTWDDEVFRLVGRSEYFSGKYQEELQSIFSTLQRGGRH
ncbi:MAG: cytochrome c biogenesis protein ResB [bacterium]|nr:cytochrome c biogenesis protein ResB [bacterium]